MILKGTVCGILPGKGQEWSQCSYFIYSRLPWRICWHPEERHRKDAKNEKKDAKKKKMLILLLFLCQLILKIIRNTSSNLIMLLVLWRNFSSTPLPFIFTLVDWKQWRHSCVRSIKDALTMFYRRIYIFTHAEVRVHVWGSMAFCKLHRPPPKAGTQPLFEGR